MDKITSRLTSDVALIVILAAIAAGTLFNTSVIWVAQTQQNKNTDDIIKLCSAVDIINDTQKNFMVGYNAVLEKRDQPGDFSIRTTLQVALNDIKDSADIIDDICQ